MPSLTLKAVAKPSYAYAHMTALMLIQETLPLTLHYLPALLHLEVFSKDYIGSANITSVVTIVVRGYNFIFHG